MITLFGHAHFFNVVSFLLYPTEVKRLKCAMLGAFTVHTHLESWNMKRERSGSVVECLTRDRRFEPHRRHCVVVLEQDTFILA